MKTETVEITPEFAKGVLETKNANNRSLSSDTVKRYASDMKNGDFILTHECVAFDDRGNLLDGQHRLAAVVLSNKATKMRVTFDVPYEAARAGGVGVVRTQSVIDSGKKRSAADNFTMISKEFPKDRLAILRILFNYANSLDRAMPLTNSQLERIDDVVGDHIESAIAAKRSVTKGFPIPHYAMAGLVWYSISHEKDATQLLANMIMGNGVGGQLNPAIVFARWSASHPKRTGSDTLFFGGVIAQVIRAHHAGEQLPKISQSPQHHLQWLMNMNPQIKQQIMAVKHYIR